MYAGCLRLALVIMTPCIPNCFEQMTSQYCVMAVHLCIMEVILWKEAKVESQHVQKDLFCHFSLSSERLTHELGHCTLSAPAGESGHSEGLDGGLGTLCWKWMIDDGLGT